MARERPMPMPVDIVLQHPSMYVAGQVAHSAILQIAIAYWVSGCQPLAESDSDLAQMARTTSAAWVRHGERIRAALAEILPALCTARRAELSRKEALSIRSKRAYAQALARNAPMPHHSPHHVSKVRKGRAASEAEQAAQAALEQAGVTDRRLAVGELGGVVASGHTVVTLPPVDVQAVIARDRVASNGAQRKLFDTTRAPK